ncbi:hypothetical protein AKJ16_DCAP01873 [Drosera capensis]
MSVEAWMKKLKWDGVDGFLDAERKVGKVNGELAGSVAVNRTASPHLASGAELRRRNSLTARLHPLELERK